MEIGESPASGWALPIYSYRHFSLQSYSKIRAHHLIFQGNCDTKVRWIEIVTSAKC